MTRDDTNPEAPLVGRTEELGAISRAIDGLAGQRGGKAVFLVGEAGIGKTALAQFAADAARSRGYPVYQGMAWEAGGAPAYWPWSQLLRSLVDEQRVPVEQLQNLGTLMPGIAPADDAVGLNPEHARFRLLEGVRLLLEKASRKQPLVLILEDLHAADNDSLLLLQFIVRQIGSLQLLLIGTFRDLEARASPASGPLWEATRGALTLYPGRLGEQDIRTLLARRGKATPDARELRRLCEATEGNPLFVCELVVLLTRDEQRADPGQQLPTTIQQLIRQQLALLPVATRSVLARASVLGRQFTLDAVAAVIGRLATDIEGDLAAAVDSGFILQADDHSYRYAHTLHREVLYLDLPPSDRKAAHLRYTAHLKSRIAAGDPDCWGELAGHLRAAGGEFRMAAIDAWRKAAERAVQRLAFQDAVDLLTRALDTFGAGPGFDAEKRFELLLDGARALQLSGSIEQGRQYCRDAFAIAETVADPYLMARAALAWGTAIVVARLDSELIAALQRSLEALPQSDVSTRSRVQARLAAAMQPAIDPSGPMEMARDAIRLARSTGDEQVIYAVLRSAISALMDFAAVAERVALNREFGELAEKNGNVPDQFRTALRLMVDASEAGDRGAMDQSILDCVRIANRIGLPHYLWRADSARAMQALIDGRFARANELLESALAHAAKIDELEAKITLSIQRFMLLIEWDSDEAPNAEDIEATLQEAYAGGLEGAEFFVTPFIAAHKTEHRQAAHRLLANKSIIERTFDGGDRYSVGRIGELAIVNGDIALAERAYDACVAYQEECAILGLMGSCWCGPVALSLGVIAAGLGRTDRAYQHLSKALEIATKMRAEPFIARIHWQLQAVAEARGDGVLASQHGTAGDRIAREIRLRRVRQVPAGRREPEPVVPAVGEGIALKRSGDAWQLSFRGHSALLRDSKGLAMLAQLLARPDDEIHVLDLSGSPVINDDAGGTGSGIDAKARAEYERRVTDIREELAEAEAMADIGRAEALQNELDFIVRELSRAFGLGGRPRQGASASERARVNVRRRLVDAIERIGEQLPDAGRFLEKSIKTGTYCKYSPF